MMRGSSRRNDTLHLILRDQRISPEAIGVICGIVFSIMATLYRSAHGTRNQEIFGQLKAHGLTVVNMHLSNFI